MEDKRHSRPRPLGQQPGPILGRIYRQGLDLQARQHEWNRLLALEAQDRTWLLGWRGGTLQVLCQSGAWLAWLRRNEKKILKQWNARFPGEEARQVAGSVRPWPDFPARKPALRSRPPLQGPAPAELRSLMADCGEPLRSAIARLVETLDQAGAAASDSTKEKGARSSEG